MTLLEKIQAAREKQNKLLVEAKSLVDRAEQEDRGLLAEEREQHKRIFDQIDTQDDLIKRWEQQDAAEKRLLAADGTALPTEPDDGDDVERRSMRGNPLTPEQRFDLLVRYRRNRMIEEDAPNLRELRQAQARWFRETIRAKLIEHRDLQSDDDSKGGYLHGSQMFVAELLKELDNAVYMRQWGTVYTVRNADSLGQPYLAADPEDANWTSEIASIDKDTAMSFGQRSLQPQKCSKYVLVSKHLMRTSALDVETLVRERLLYKYRVTEEKGFLTGNGAEEPLGIFTASDDGISTSRDVDGSSYDHGNTTTELGPDSFLEALYSITNVDQRNLRWIMHRDCRFRLALLKDGDTRPLLQPNPVVGEPMLLHGYPMYMSEYAPNTFTASQYVAVIGDFSHYVIADALNAQLRYNPYLKDLTSQDVFILEAWCDGMPRLESAFARVAMAAS